MATAEDLRALIATRWQEVEQAQAEVQEELQWLCNHTAPPLLHQRLEIPVLCLRWTHASINRNMMFGHGGEDNESIFKLVDQLQRGETTPGDIHEPLDS